MRMKRKRLVEVYHRKMTTEKDAECHNNVFYGPASGIKVEMWPAGGKLQAEMYGVRLPNIRNLRVDGAYQEVCVDGVVRFQLENGPAITVKDGINLYTAAGDDPDYEIVAIRPFGHLTLEVERRVGV